MDEKYKAKLMGQGARRWDAVVRHYYGGPDTDQAPYTGNLHELGTDIDGVESKIRRFYDDLPDRTPVRITVEILGEPRLDLPRWSLLEPHFYGPETGRAPWPENYAYYSEACLHGRCYKCDGLSAIARDLPYPQQRARGPCRCEHHEPGFLPDPTKSKNLARLYHKLKPGSVDAYTCHITKCALHYPRVALAP